MKGLLVSLVVGCILVVGGGALLAAPTDPGQDLSIKVIGLAVCEPYGAGPGESPFFVPQGTSTVMLVKCPGKSVVSVDDEACALKSLQDAQGNDLRGVKPPTSWMAQEPIACEVVDDGKAVVVMLHGWKVPAKGASGIKAEGTLKLGVATQLGEEMQRNVSLIKGSKITAGPVPLEITQVAEGAARSGPQVRVTSRSSDFGEEFAQEFAKAFEGAFAGMGEAGTPAMQMKLQAKADISGIASMTFYDAAGAEVEHQVLSESWMSAAGTKWVTREIGLSKKLDKAHVKIEFWKDLEQKEVPFAFEVGLSLQ